LWSLMYLKRSASDRKDKSQKSLTYVVSGLQVEDLKVSVTLSVVCYALDVISVCYTVVPLKADYNGRFRSLIAVVRLRMCDELDPSDLPSQVCRGRTAEPTSVPARGRLRSRQRRSLLARLPTCIIQRNVD